MSVDDVLERNREFVRGRAARPLPPPETVDTVILACYDPRLDALLRPSLGLDRGQAFLMRSAGAAVGPTGDPLRSIALATYLFSVSRVIVVGHTSCRMAAFDAARFADAFRSRGVARSAFGDADLRSWAGAIPDPARGVRSSVAALRSASCLPPDLSVSGLLLDDGSGELSVVVAPDQTVDGRPIAAAPAGLEEGMAHGGSDVDGAALGRATSPLPTPAPPGARVGLVEAARGLIDAVSSQAVWRVELQRLRTQLHNQTSPVARLRLIEAFLRKAAGDSREIADAFERLRQAASEMDPAPDRATLIDLVRRIFLGETP
jgi:carbonic anhydrase